MLFRLYCRFILKVNDSSLCIPSSHLHQVTAIYEGNDSELTQNLRKMSTVRDLVTELANMMLPSMPRKRDTSASPQSRPT